MYNLISYIKFLIHSTNQHGVHSPFVYDLITKCFYNKSVFPAYSELKRYQNTLLTSKETDNIADYEQRAKRRNAKKQNIPNSFKHRGKSFKALKLLYRISNYFQFNTVLELDTALGLRAHALVLGKPDMKLIAMDDRPNMMQFTKQQFYKLGLSNINFVNSDFEPAYANLEHSTLDCILFGGHYTKTKLLRYFNLLVSKTHNNSVFIFDKIYASPEMTKAWKIISQDQRVTVSIDTFYFGFIFFRTEQPKQHFRIRV